MPQPIIGLTTNLFPYNEKGNRFGTSENYVNSILKSGGIPVLLPYDFPDTELVNIRHQFDGLVVIGGPDINPDLFGGQPHPAVYGVDNRRDKQEVSLIRLAVETGWPIFGICRGFQMINVAFGGSLFTDLPDQVSNSLKHKGWPDDYLAHDVTIKEDSRLARIVGRTKIQVNSMHHQGIKNLAPRLSPVAYAPDGIIEAVEINNHPFGLAVQWHPECLPGNPLMHSIFEAFIAATKR